MRVLHWSLAAGFLGAFMLDSPRDLHETLGWIAVAVGVGFILLAPLIKKLMHLDTLRDDAEGSVADHGAQPKPEDARRI